MTLGVWLLVIASVSISATAQLLMKLGMSSARVQGQLAGASVVDAALAIATNPHVVGGLFAYGVTAIMWLIVLSRIPLSMAYSMVALGFIFVAMLSWLVLHESLPPIRIAGIALIVIGVTLVGRS